VLTCSVLLKNEFAAGGPNERDSLGQVAATLAIESETAGTVNDVGFGCSGGFGFTRFYSSHDAGCFPPRFVQQSKFVIQQSEFSGTTVGIPWRHNREAFRLSGIDSL
jgi:hypothetical protein